MRRKDDTRINQRNDRKLRKQQEKKLKQEELKRLKNLKMEEIKKKLAQIQELAGGEALGFDNADIEDDFDPEAYDNKMQESFGNDYYSAKDPLRKPVFEDDIEIDDIVPAPKKSKTFKESKLIAPCDEEDFNMDADYQPDVKTSATEIKEFREKEQMEELYRLDYEDIIAGQPVRFKYRTVEPNNYGLKIDELLEAEDQDLNAVVSLKKMAPFRPEAKKQQDAQKWKKYKKKKLWEFRSKLIGRVLTKNEPEVVPEKKSSDKAAVGEQRLNAYKSGKNH